MCEETVDETHLVDDEETEGETYEPRDDSQAAIETGKAVFGNRKGDGNRGGDEHHAGDSANPEDEKIKDSPGRNTDCREHEQGNGSRAGQTVNDANGQWPDDLIEAQGAKDAIHPSYGCRGISMAAFFGFVAVRMAVNVVAVPMGIGVICELRGREDFRNPAHDPGKIQNSEKNQHKAHREFHGETDSGWNYDAEQNDCGADDENRYGVTKPPENTDQSSLPNAALATDDRRDRDDVVRIGSVAHAEEEAENNDRKKSDHLFLDRSGGAETCAPIV